MVNEDKEAAQAKIQAKLDEMKLKRAGKIPQNANVESPSELKVPERPNQDEFNEAIQKVVEIIKEKGLFPDQIYHLGTELQLVATNDMIMNGLQNFGHNVENYIKEKVTFEEMLKDEQNVEVLKEVIKEEYQDKLNAMSEILSNMETDLDVGDLIGLKEKINNINNIFSEKPIRSEEVTKETKSNGDEDGRE